jgi:hypothetical protein
MMPISPRCHERPEFAFGGARRYVELRGEFPVGVSFHLAVLADETLPTLPVRKVELQP